MNGVFNTGKTIVLTNSICLEAMEMEPLKNDLSLLIPVFFSLTSRACNGSVFNNANLTDSCDWVDFFQSQDSLKCKREQGTTRFYANGCRP